MVMDLVWLLGVLITFAFIVTVILSYMVPWVKFQIFKVDKAVDKVTRWHKED